MLTTCLLLLTLQTPAQLAEDPPVRYLKQQGEKYVLESEIRTTESEKGSSYVSRTERGTEKMTLKLDFDEKKKLSTGEITWNSGKATLTAQVIMLSPEMAQLKYGTMTEFVKLKGEPIVTTAPDWSDIFQLVKHYDATKAGKQEFQGLWVHPKEKHQLLNFTVERLSTNEVLKHAGKDLKLSSYRIRLRSGDYLVWADENRRVIKLASLGPKANPIVLQGFEESAKELK